MEDFKKFREIGSSQIVEIRQILLEKQNSKCAICEKELQESTDRHVDHQHLFKHQELGTSGNGLIRGVLCRDCNALEGKIWNAAHRYGKANLTDPVNSRIEWLRKLISYYQNNLQHQDPILHPKERRIEKLPKSVYNKIFKFFKDQESSYRIVKGVKTLKKFPKYTGKWNTKLVEIKEKMDADKPKSDSGNG